MAPELIIVPTLNIAHFAISTKDPVQGVSLKVFPPNGKHRQIVRALALIGYTVAPGWSGRLSDGRLLPRVIQLMGGG